MDFSIAFVMYFFHGLYLIGPLIISLMIVIIGLGQVAGRIESWKKFDTFYEIHPCGSASASLRLTILNKGYPFHLSQ